MGSKGSSSQPIYLPTVQNTSQGGSSSSQATTTQTPNPLAQLAYQQTLANANQIAQTPFEPYQGQRVAGFTPDQLAAFQGARNTVGIQNPYISGAMSIYDQSMQNWQNPMLAPARQAYDQSFNYITNPFQSQTQNYLTNALQSAINMELPTTKEYFQRSINAAQNPFLGQSQGYFGESVGISDQERFNQQALNRYMNPYQQSVVNATLAQMKQNQDVLQNQNTANAIRQGAYGGSGQFMGQAELGRQQALANAQTLAGLNAQNYQQAMAQYNQQQQQAIQARQQAGQLLAAMGQSQAGLNVNALQQAAQTLGQLGQSQAGLLAGTGVNAAQLMGQLGSQQAERGIQAYQQAAQGLGQLGQQQQALGINALQNAAAGLSGLGTQAQQAALRDTQTLLTTGQMQQQLQQQQLQNAYDQWLQAKAYPYQQTSYFAGLAGGLGPLLGNTASQTSSGTTSSSGSGSGISPYQPQQSGGGQIPGLITTGLGLLGSLFGLKDGGKVTGRKAFAGGGEAEEEDLVSLMTAPLYGEKGLESPVTSQAGLGSLMFKTPYSAPDDYIGNAAKVQKAMMPASSRARANLEAKIDKALNLVPELREIDLDIESTMKKWPRYTGATETGSGWEDAAKSAGKLLGSEKFQSGVSKGLGSLSSAFSEFNEGGRVGREEGGVTTTPANPQVAALYPKLFERGPDPEGLAYWSQQAAGGMSLGDIQRSFQQSPEGQIRGAYRDILQRRPESRGADYWSQQLSSGMTPEQMRQAMQGSIEKSTITANPSYRFVSSEPTGTSLSDIMTTPAALELQRLAPSGIGSYADLTRQVYAQNPGRQRTPEEQGMPSMPSQDYYSNQGSSRRFSTGDGNLGIAQSMGLPDRANVVTPSTPYASADAARSAALSAIQNEQTALAFAYTAMGLDAGLATVLAVQNTQGKVAQANRDWEAAKAEIDARLAQQPPVQQNQAERLGLSANYQDFVTSLYKNYYGRDPSEAEINTQLRSIVSGAKPIDVESALRTSPEGTQTQKVQKLYEEYLGRPADLGGLSYWKQQLSRGTPLMQVSDLIRTSPEARSAPSSAPVQGYYSKIASNQINPYTGLYNLEYTAPYRGTTVRDFLPRKDGGRVEKAAGGALGGKDLYNYLISLGANEKEATMLTGMAKTESNFNPYVMHDQNTGFGLWGHGKDRWADMQKYTGERKPGWQDQAKFALWELRNSPKVSLARQALNKADDARDVAIAGMHFERPRGYTAAAPWLGMNWRDRFSNVENLMLGRDLGKGPELRLAEGEPNRESMMYKNVATPATSERPRGLIPRLLAELAPVKSAQAAESAPAERKSMFAWPELRNPRMATLPEALGRPNWPNAEPGPLPDWKKEVQVGFGPLQGERPADERQLVEPLPREVATPLPPRRPDSIVAEDDAGKSKQKYWGDWRDAEPFKSDPIGGFFDTLMGDKPQSDQPGALERSNRRSRSDEEEDNPLKSIGDLFSFADGGVARHGYALGGEPVEEEEFDPLGSLGSAIESGLGGLGDTIGGLFGEGKDAGSAEEAAIVASDRIPSKRGMSPLSEGLLAAGLGMLAAPTRDPWQAVGVGGLRGLQVYETASEQARKQEEAAAKQAAAEQAADLYQRKILGLGPVSEDQAEEKETAPALAPSLAPKPLEPAPIETAPQEETPSGVVDIEADPSLRRLTEQYARVASIPAPKEMQSVKTAQLSNLKFQIEERRRQLESSVRARKEQQEAAQSTPEAKARAKQLEVAQEALAKEAVATEQAARQADQRIATLSRMKDAVSSGRFRTGAFAEKELALKKAVQSVFPSMVDEDAVAMAEQFDKDALQAVTDATGGKLGAGVSDSDVRFLTRQQAGLGTTKAGNVRTLDAAIKIEQRKKDIADFARKYKESHGGVLDQGYYEQLSKWSDEHPMFPEEKTSKTGTLTADTVPEGHEIQRGNSTYRWDSSSKKYKRVQ